MRGGHISPALLFKQTQELSRNYDEAPNDIGANVYYDLHAHKRLHTFACSGKQSSNRKRGRLMCNEMRICFSQIPPPLYVRVDDVATMRYDSMHDAMA